ncbi:hypothetical protein HY572_05785 [Candidatus Micrarchaeota archaeon]|nr:hypothetical protein [Candidatus Micrarchaeota archaeon]
MKNWITVIGFLALLSVSLSANVRPIFLNQDPDPAAPGHYVELRFKVEKTTTAEIRDMQFRLDVVYPFSFDGSDTPTRSFGSFTGATIGSDNQFILKYKVFVAPGAQTDKAEVKLYYRDSAQDWTEFKFNIAVDDSQPNLVLGSVKTTPDALFGDFDGAKVSIALTNIGDKDAQNVQATLRLPEGFEPSFGYSDQSVYGTITQGSSQSADFYVDLNESVAKGSYPAQLFIQFKHVNDPQTDYRNASIPVNLQVKGRPQFKVVSVKTTPDALHPGTKATVNVVIENVGSDEGKSTSLKAFKESTQPFEFDDKSDFIGNLKPGEKGEAVLSVNVAQNADPKIYRLNVEARSIYNDQVVLSTDTIQLDVQPGGATGFEGKDILLVLLLAATAFLAYRQFGPKTKGGQIESKDEKTGKDGGDHSGHGGHRTSGHEESTSTGSKTEAEETTEPKRKVHVVLGKKK